MSCGRVSCSVLQSLETSEQCCLPVSVCPCQFCSLCCSYLYKIAHLGDDDGEREFLSDYPLEEGETFFFTHRPLKNLVLVDEMESLSPIMACQVLLLLLHLLHLLLLPLLHLLRLFPPPPSLSPTQSSHRLQTWLTRTRPRFMLLVGVALVLPCGYCVMGWR